jgi:hypothetical protein
MNVSNNVAAAQPASFADMKALFTKQIQKMQSQDPEKAKEMEAFGSKVEALTKKGMSRKEAVMTAREQSMNADKTRLDRSHQNRKVGSDTVPVRKQDRDVVEAANNAAAETANFAGAETVNLAADLIPDPSIYGSRTTSNANQGMPFIGIWTQGSSSNTAANESVNDNRASKISDMRNTFMKNLYGSKTSQSSSIGDALLGLMG